MIIPPPHQPVVAVVLPLTIIVIIIITPGLNPRAPGAARRFAARMVSNTANALSRVG